MTGAVEAVWRLESARIVAALVRIVHDVGRAEEFAQDALVAALEQWPAGGVPDNPGAWLTAVAKRRAIDHVRREQRLPEPVLPGPDQPDDVLRLLFLSCHPVLSAESRVALTLRVVAGLTAAEIGRAFLTTEQVVVQRITAAKRELAGVPFELPAGPALRDRLASVLEVIYLVFNEGYAASSGADVLRPGLCLEALRMGRLLAGLAPDEAEAHGLVALMEILQSRSAARIGPGGEPVPLPEQNRGRWDPLLIRRGFTAMLRARELGGPPGPYVLQAAIAVCHAQARSAEETDWARIAALYEALARLLPTAVVRLNQAVAVGRAYGPAAGLLIADTLLGEPVLRDYHLLPAVRADLLERLGRDAEAGREFRRAADLSGNAAERDFLLRRAARLDAAEQAGTLGGAAAAFLARDDLGAATVRAYSQTLRRLTRTAGESLPLAELTPDVVARVFATAWPGVAAQTWNRHVSAVRTFGAWAGRPDLSAGLDRRAADRPRTAAMTGPDHLWQDPGRPLRERVLWRMVHESQAPVRAVLDLNVEDLDLDDRRARSGRRWVTWRSGTAGLLPELIGDRRRGPLFLTGRRPGPARTAADRDLCPQTGRRRLSYERAEYLFKQATGHTLRQL